MDGKMLARLLAVVFIAIAITAAAIDIARRDEPAASRPAPSFSPETPRADPLRDALLRCQRMGEAAIRDADCLATWAESRRRFLGQPEGR
jgi:conjugative transfer region protein TrbK